MKFIASLLILFTILVIGTQAFLHINLNQDCTGHLKRAADANTVQMASTELDFALNYLEERGDTIGYTSVIYQTPSEDVGYFYQNLKASKLEISKVDSTTTSFEKTNMLMKLRETLLDEGKEGSKVTKPLGLATFPNNFLWGLMSILGVISLVGGVLLWQLSQNSRYHRKY